MFSLIFIDKREELEKIIVDEDGVIVSSKAKAFSKEVLKKRSASRVVNAETKKKKEETEVSNEMAMGDSIFKVPNLNEKTVEEVQISASDSTRNPEPILNETNENARENDKHDLVDSHQKSSQKLHHQDANLSESNANVSTYSGESNLVQSGYLFDIPNVTEEQIYFQKRLLASMEFSMDKKVKSKLFEELAVVNKELSSAGSGKVPIFF